jgi:DnaJ-class molecular chaperone
MEECAGGYEKHAALCSTCEGKGEIPCGYCKGKGKRERRQIDVTAFDETVEEECILCDGTGLVPCPDCSGDEKT